MLHKTLLLLLLLFIFCIPKYLIVTYWNIIHVLFLCASSTIGDERPSPTRRPDAALVIQCAWRCYEARRLLNAIVTTNQRRQKQYLRLSRIYGRNATIIQKYVRRLLAKKYLANMVLAHHKRMFGLEVPAFIYIYMYKHE